MCNPKYDFECGINKTLDCYNLTNNLGSQMGKLGRRVKVRLEVSICLFLLCL